MAQQTLPRHVVASAPARARDEGLSREGAGDNRAFLLMTIVGVVAMYAVAMLIAVKF